ncbi:FxDxF family PEP-CTERM protein [Nitrosospira sp. Is2]|jgi:hypothetical protein|uniref:FxDxF family PEP-CTERM protein n=1 Tax=Nitrosospira sp. Is2 TaxID=3080532 RepID=UPI002953BD81|nr:FxDxF family PEP-CTERM protein [Nitrosospira sp. Is2]WON72622.1 FxDxF family PEP-CTERM protein [Nitrosospira sp. Is2]
MIKNSMKLTFVAAMLAGMSVGANAATTDLGTLNTDPTTFGGTVSGTGVAFSDIFTFDGSQSIASSFSVVDVPLTVGGVNFDGILTGLSLFSAGANGVVGGGDDTLLGSSAGTGAGDSLTLNYDQPLSGASFITVTGISNGSAGAIYAGAMAAAIPEPETYAMLLAGLGLMGAVVRRRSNRKTS